MAQKLKKIFLLTYVVAFFGLALSPVIAYAADADPCENNKPTPQSLNNCVKQNPIIHDIQVVVNILSALVGVVVVGTIVLGGVQYIMAGAGGSSEDVNKAKQRIMNGAIALLVYFFMFALLQWLIPGGVFQ